MKPQINIWVEDKDLLLNQNLKESFQNNEINYSYKNLLNLFFYNNFNFWYDIKIKKINSDIINPEDRNFIVYPCPSYQSLISSLSKVNQKQYDFVFKNKMKILFNYVRECPNSFPDLDNHIAKLKEKYDLKYFKIIVNAFDNIKQTLYPDIFLKINYFEKLMYNYTNVSRVGFNKEEIKNPILRFPGVKKDYSFYKNRKYKFSLLTGTLFERFERVLFLYEMFLKGILNKFFISTIVLDEKQTNDYILKESNLRNLTLPQCFLEEVIKHRVYNENGSPLSSFQHIYNSRVEYQIPLQVTQSYINIVLETMKDVPCITEKLYKPIIAGVPFIWAGPKNVLCFLESQGYQKYPFIDYSFDTLDEYEDRLSCLSQEVERLDRLNLKKEVLSCQKIAQHNQKMFYLKGGQFEDILK